MTPKVRWKPADATDSGTAPLDDIAEPPEPVEPLQVTLGELLEAHHRRFVKRVEELKRKGELE